MKQWFIVENQNKKIKKEEETESKQAVNRYLSLYQKALCQYFQTEANHIEELVQKAKKKNLSKGESLFLGYIEEKMIPFFRIYLNIPYPNNDQFVAKVDYDFYILNEEVQDYSRPECVRSSLISFVNDFPEYVTSH